MPNPMTKVLRQCPRCGRTRKHLATVEGDRWSVCLTLECLTCHAVESLQLR